MTTMRPTTSTASRAVPSLLAAVVVSLVLGIIGMHALSIGGVATDDAGHSTVLSMTGSPGDMPAAAPDTGPMAAADAGMPAEPGNGKGHDMGSMVMLCFAMLAATAGALLLLFLGLRRRPRVRAYRPAAPTTVTKWVTARLGTGPPYVWNFSVIRC